MSLVTFIDNSAASATPQLVMPADLTINARRINSIIVGAAGNVGGVCVTITNCIADSGATFTAYVGTATSAVLAGNVFRGATIPLPYKGLRVGTNIPTTITAAHAAVASVITIEYEKG